MVQKTHMCDDDPLWAEHQVFVDRQVPTRDHPCAHWLITHAHKDHADHLVPRVWRECPQTQVYCTPWTARLLMAQRPALADWASQWTLLNYGQICRVIPGVLHIMLWPNEHCLGAAMVWCQWVERGEVWLVTGDWKSWPQRRVTERGARRAWPRPWTRWPVTRVYYDATWSHRPERTPSRREAEAASEAWFRDGRVRYWHAETLGGEWLVMRLLRTNPTWRWWVDPRLKVGRRWVWQQLLPQDQETSSEKQAHIRLSARRWAGSWPQGSHAIAVGWTHTQCRRAQHKTQRVVWEPVMWSSHATQYELAELWRRFPRARRIPCGEPVTCRK